MANLTVTIDSRLLKAARMRALREDTSVNSLVRDYLLRYAADSDSSSTDTFLAVARESDASSAGVAPWTRADLHAR